MSEAVTHQLLMLRPMQAGLSGYARLQGEAGRQLVQINLRGLNGGRMRAFWYAGDGLVRELGNEAANARGEASLTAAWPVEATGPRRLMPLLLTDGSDRPRPLAIGLCTAQSAGSLMDAKNALLALCDKLSREAEAAAQRSRQQEAPFGSPKADETAKKGTAKVAAAAEAGRAKKAPAPSATDALPTHGPADAPARSAAAGRDSTPDDPLPREVFLPAIHARLQPQRRRSRKPAPTDAEQADGAAVQPQQQAASAIAVQQPQLAIPAAPAASPGVQPMRSPQPAASAATADQQPPPPAHARPARHNPIPADQLPALHWPVAFRSLAEHFDRYPPIRLMNWPGWRFVRIPQEPGGLWIGYEKTEDRVTRVAYALPGDAQPPGGQPFRPAVAADGQSVQLLVLRA